MDDPEPYSFIFTLSTYLGSNIDWSIIVALIVLMLLLLFSALVSGSEVAFFSLTPNDKQELNELKNNKSTSVLELLQHPKELLAIILILNNFVNVAIIVLSSYLFSVFYPINQGNTDYLRLFSEIVGITFIILLIGELIPKVYANRNSLKLSLFMAKPLAKLQVIPPFSWMQNWLVNGTEIILKSARKRAIDVSAEDLETAIALTREENSSEEDHKILEGIVNFGNTDVKQIMRSRVDTVAIDSTLNYHELLEMIVESGYSRIPVYKGTFDEVIGIIYIKDLLPFLNEKENFDWNALIRAPFFVPENKKIDDLLKEFQEKKIHMAVVVDEYGGASGVVTLEDVLEEIVGEITDEFDDEDITYTKVDQNTFIFEGKTALVDVYKVLDIDGKNFEAVKGEADSLAGFLVEQCGEILKNKQSYEFDNLKFVVEAADMKRIKRIKIIRLNKQEYEN